nr:MAG TPA: hypothetical protein [Caudoviricetes sp.]
MIKLVKGDVEYVVSDPVFIEALKDAGYEEVPAGYEAEVETVEEVPAGYEAEVETVEEVEEADSKKK